MINCTDIYGKIHKIEKSKLIKRPSAYGIYIKDHKILIIQNLLNLKWELPGGGLDKNENDFLALEREFKEETGLKTSGEYKKIYFQTNFFFDLFTNSGEGWDSLKTYYLIKNAKGSLIQGNGDDSKASKFIGARELKSLFEQNNLNNINKILLNKIIKLLR